MMHLRNLFITALTLIAWAVNSEARGGNDGRRDPILFGGLGISRALLDLNDVNSRSTFAGWGPDGEAGIELPFGSGGWGMQGSGFAQRIELLNTTESKTYTEKATLDAVGAKLGFFYSNLTFGAGAKQSRMEVTSIPDTTNSKVVINGLTTFYWGSFSFDYRGQFRAAAEGQYSNGNLDTRRVESYQIGLRLSILFDL